MSTSTERMRRLRARRAAGLEADPDARLRDAGDLLGPAVAETIAALQLGEQDQAAAAMAIRYAQVIDQAKDAAWALRWIGPHLLDTLQQLGATPASRHTLTKGQPPQRQGPSPLDQLRVRRVNRPGSA